MSVPTTPVGARVEAERAKRILMIAKLAQEIAADITPDMADTARDASYHPLLLSAAMREYKERGFRHDCGFEDFIGEPAWDMLLDFYIHHHSGARISVTSACLASRVASTTALRYINALTDKGWVRRISDQGDKRRDWLDLTEAGVAQVEKYLERKCSVRVLKPCAERSDKRRTAERAAA